MSERISDEVFRGFLNWFMSADPWPLLGEDGERAHALLEEYADEQARLRGHENWIVSFHEVAP